MESSKYDFATPNDFEVERKLLASLFCVHDEERAKLLEYCHDGLFAHPLCRWLFVTARAAHDAGHVRNRDFMLEMVRARYNGHQGAYLVARLWHSVDGKVLDFNVRLWRSYYHQLRLMDSERVRLIG